MRRVLFFAFSLLAITSLFSSHVSLASNGKEGTATFPNGLPPEIKYPANVVPHDSSQDINSSDYFGIVPDPFPNNTFPWVTHYPQNATTSYGNLANLGVLTLSGTSTNKTVYYFSFTPAGVAALLFPISFNCGATAIYNSSIVQSYNSGNVVLRCPAGSALNITNVTGVTFNYIVIWGEPWYDSVSSSLPVAWDSSSTNNITMPVEFTGELIYRMYLYDALVVILVAWFIYKIIT